MIKTGTKFMEKVIENTWIEFLPEPFIIEESDKMEVYRFNVGEVSPYFSDQKWNYQSKAIRTKNSEGIFGLPDGEHCLPEVFDRLRKNVTGEDKRELVILKLHVDKKKILYYNAKESCFTECNIIEKLTIGEFITQVYPNCFGVIEAFRQAMGTSSEEIKNDFVSALCKLNGYHHLLYLEKRLQNEMLEKNFAFNYIKSIGRDQDFKNGLIQWMQSNINNR